MPKLTFNKIKTTIETPSPENITPHELNKIRQETNTTVRIQEYEYFNFSQAQITQELQRFI